MILYILPEKWVKYDSQKINQALVDAKAAVLALQSVPYQRSWVEVLQQMELKREVAGTSRIEGAEFTEKELNAAMKESPEQLFTRSQRQANAAVRTYRWISKLPNDVPINADLIMEIHRKIITGADDDHCPPGHLREGDNNVNFGQPVHRGVQAGEECTDAFSKLCEALQKEFPAHDPLIQALASHYNLAAMHPFLDGNGRTARALEALMLQRAGLRDTFFVAMSNYYYDEKPNYLKALTEVRAGSHDLTPFLVFALEGISSQCGRVLTEIQQNISKALFRNLMLDLFHRLRNKRKRVIVERQLEILNQLLEVKSMTLDELTTKTARTYNKLRNPFKALVRDLNELIHLKAITVERISENQWKFEIRLGWPTEITETELFEKLKKLPKAKTHSFLQ